MTSITIGGVKISTFLILLTLGVLLGLGVTCFEGQRRFRNSGTALDLGLGVVFGGFAGGWIGALLIYWLGRNQIWGQTVQKWEGQLSFPGAFLGGLVGMGLFVWSHRRDERRLSFWEWADLITPGLALGVSAVWTISLALGQKSAGPHFNFEAGYVLLPDLDGIEQLLNRGFDFCGVVMPSFALQGVGICLASILGAAFWLLRKRWPFAGAASLTFVLLYFSGQFWVEVAEAKYGAFLTPLYVGPWRVGQVLALVLASLAAVGLLMLWWRARGGEVEAKATGKDSSRTIPLVVGLMVFSLIAGAALTPSFEEDDFVVGETAVSLDHYYTA